MSADAAIAGSDPNDPLTVHQDVLCREPGEHVDALGLHLLGEPSDEQVERDDEVPVIPERRRDDRKRDPAALGQEIDVIGMDVNRKL